MLHLSIRLQRQVCRRDRMGDLWGLLADLKDAVVHLYLSVSVYMFLLKCRWETCGACWPTCKTPLLTFISLYRLVCFASNADGRLFGVVGRLVRRLCSSLSLFIGLFVMRQMYICPLYTSPSPRDQRGDRMPSSPCNQQYHI